MAGSSAEYDTMITLTTDLQLATKSDLTFLSGALLGENLISSRNGSELRNVAHSEEDRAARLVELIQDKVKQNPQHYYTFISVLEKNQDYYSDILKKLHKVNKRFQNGMCPILIVVLPQMKHYSAKPSAHRTIYCKLASCRNLLAMYMTFTVIAIQECMLHAIM